MKTRSDAASKTSPAPVVSDEPEALATQARETLLKSAAEIRKQRVPIATEPPTVFRP